MDFYSSPIINYHLNAIQDLMIKMLENNFEILENNARIIRQGAKLLSSSTKLENSLAACSKEFTDAQLAVPVFTSATESASSDEDKVFDETSQQTNRKPDVVEFAQSDATGIPIAYNDTTQSEVIASKEEYPRNYASQVFDKIPVSEIDLKGEDSIPNDSSTMNLHVLVEMFPTFSAVTYDVLVSNGRFWRVHHDFGLHIRHWFDTGQTIHVVGNMRRGQHIRLVHELQVLPEISQRTTSSKLSLIASMESCTVANMFVVLQSSMHKLWHNKSDDQVSETAHVNPLLLLTVSSAALRNVCAGAFSAPAGITSRTYSLEHMLFYASRKYYVKNSEEPTGTEAIEAHLEYESSKDGQASTRTLLVHETPFSRRRLDIEVAPYVVESAVKLVKYAVGGIENVRVELPSVKFPIGRVLSMPIGDCNRLDIVHYHHRRPCSCLHLELEPILWTITFHVDDWFDSGKRFKNYSNMLSGLAEACGNGMTRLVSQSNLVGNGIVFSVWDPGVSRKTMTELKATDCSESNVHKDLGELTNYAESELRLAQLPLPLPSEESCLLMQHVENDTKCSSLTYVVRASYKQIFRYSTALLRDDATLVVIVSITRLLKLKFVYSCNAKFAQNTVSAFIHRNGSNLEEPPDCLSPLGLGPPYFGQQGGAKVTHKPSKIITTFTIMLQGCTLSEWITLAVGPQVATKVALVEQYNTLLSLISRAVHGGYWHVIIKDTQFLMLQQLPGALTMEVKVEMILTECIIKKLAILLFIVVFLCPMTYSKGIWHTNVRNDVPYAITIFLSDLNKVWYEHVLLTKSCEKMFFSLLKYEVNEVITLLEHVNWCGCWNEVIIFLKTLADTKQHILPVQLRIEVLPNVPEVQRRIEVVERLKELAEAATLLDNYLQNAYSGQELKADIQHYLQLLRELSSTEEAAKRFLLVANSDYHYMAKRVTYSFNNFIPCIMSGRDLFYMAIILVRKPKFFEMLYPMVHARGAIQSEIGLVGEAISCATNYKNAEVVSQYIKLIIDALLVTLKYYSGYAEDPSDRMDFLSLQDNNHSSKSPISRLLSLLADVDSNGYILTTPPHREAAYLLDLDYTRCILLQLLPNSNLEDKVLFEGGGNVMSGNSPIEDMGRELATFMWDPG